MNPAITSREEILKQARELAGREGLSHISIRKLAQQCGVSVGCIYRYFPDKAELVAAILEQFWKGAFHGVSWEKENHQDGHSFPQFVEWLYGRFRLYLTAFEADWLKEISCLGPAERKRIREEEKKYYAHIQQGLLLALDRDPRIPPWTWDAGFTREEVVRLLFAAFLQRLKDGEADGRFLRLALERLLYLPENP